MQEKTNHSRCTRFNFLSTSSLEEKNRDGLDIPHSPSPQEDTPTRTNSAENLHSYESRSTRKNSAISNYGNPVLSADSCLNHSMTTGILRQTSTSYSIRVSDTDTITSATPLINPIILPPSHNTQRISIEEEEVAVLEEKADPKPEKGNIFSRYAYIKDAFGVYMNKVQHIFLILLFFVTCLSLLVLLIYNLILAIKLIRLFVTSNLERALYFISENRTYTIYNVLSPLFILFILYYTIRNVNPFESRSNRKEYFQLYIVSIYMILFSLTYNMVSRDIFEKYF